jgi:hypothetical protein
VGERVVLVCDVCGEPATQTVTVRIAGRSLTKDLCASHLSELTAGTRPTRRGRRRKTTGAAKTQARGRQERNSNNRTTQRRRPRGARKSKKAA